jgi:hypothetical protein
MMTTNAGQTHLRIAKRKQMRNKTFIALIFCIAAFAAPSVIFASPSCDRLHNEPCEGEACLAKYKAVQGCEMAVTAEEQARSRQRQLQRQRENEIKRKKQAEETKS